MMTCFWCDTIYDINAYERCPSCQTGINTEPIKILEVEEK
jgi:hypothetical protein